MDILTRIKDIIAYSRLSVRGFSIKCNIAQKTLDNQLRGLRSISLETTAAILNTFPEISAEWLLRGEGDMILKEPDNSIESTRVINLVDAISTLQETINAKSETIATLTERIRQLESQLANK